MPDSSDEQRQPPEEIDFAALYEEHIDRLIGIAVTRFAIAPAEAATLAHEVLLSFLRHAEGVVNSERWLARAICNASRCHLRHSGRIEPLKAPQFVTQKRIARCLGQAQRRSNERQRP